MSIRVTGKDLLNEILDYFKDNERERPDRDWAFPEDYSSYCFDHRSRNGTKFWVDLERDGTIKIFWRKAGGQAEVAIFEPQD